MKIKQERVRASLAARGLPVTHQRLAIYETLAGSKEHPSAEGIHAKLKKRYPSLSLATVYKTLQTFQEIGLAKLVNFPHVEARYDAITERHHHAICERCGKIEDLFDERLDALAAPDTPGFRVTGHSVHFRGLCQSCQRRKQ